MSAALSGRWYFRTARFGERLARSMSRDKICIDGTVVAGVDGRALFLDGQARGWIWQRGELLAEVPLEICIARRDLATLRSYLEKTDAKDLDWLRLHCEGGAQEAVIAAAKQAAAMGQSLAKAVLLATYGETQAARECLSNCISSSPKADALTLAARIYQQIFSDDKMARECLSEAERKADNGWRLIACADAQMSLFHAQNEARQHLQKAAAARPSEHVGWFLCALLDDEEEARRVLELAAANAYAASRLCVLTYVYAVALDDADAARRLLAQGESRIRRSAQWGDCIRVWHDLFPTERGERLRCLAACEAKAEESDDFSQCAVLWEETTHDRKAALRCLQRAEEAAKTSFDFAACARGWHQVTGQRPDSLRFLHRAEELAKDTADWLVCADEQKKVLGDAKTARIFVQRAERLARSTSGMTSCAQTWSTLFDDRDAAHRCMQRAEELVKSPRDFDSCGLTFRIFLGDDEAAGRCKELEQEWTQADKARSEALLASTEKDAMRVLERSNHAMKLYEKILSREPPVRSAAIEASLALASAYKAEALAELKEPDLAIDQYKETVEIYKRLSSPAE